MTITNPPALVSNESGNVRVNVDSEEPFCSICEKAPRIYCCPRCGVLSCSLVCVQQHKRATGCSGRRERTAYTPLSMYDESNLQGDFHFLEDVVLSVDRAKRARHHYVGRCQANDGASDSREKGNPRTGIASELQQRQRLPVSRARQSGITASGRDTHDVLAAATNPKAALLSTGPAVKLASGALKLSGLTLQHVALAERRRMLVMAAAGRHVSLLLMPPGMSRHERNSSRLDTRTHTIFWRLDFEFPSASDGGGSTSKEFLVTNSASEESTWKSMLSSLLVEPNRSWTAPARHNLRIYRAAFRQALQSNFTCVPFRMLLRKEPQPANDPRYYELDPHATIRESLVEKTIIENPTVVVALEECYEHFPLVPPLIEDA
jgi:hypothetical protein